MLRWNQDFSSSREHWDKVLSMGMRVPQPFLDEPEIQPENQFYFQAFCDLGTERAFGMGVGPIPVSKAKDYADRHELDDREWRLFWSIIREVDTDFLSVMNKKRKDEPPPNPDNRADKSKHRPLS